MARPAGLSKQHLQHRLTRFITILPPPSGEEYVFIVAGSSLGNITEKHRNGFSWSFEDRSAMKLQINQQILGCSRSPPGPRFNIKMTSYQYRKSHCGDKTILRPSYLHNGISYTGKTTSLYWIRALGTGFFVGVRARRFLALLDYFLLLTLRSCRGCASRLLPILFLFQTWHEFSINV